MTRTAALLLVPVLTVLGACTGGAPETPSTPARPTAAVAAATAWPGTAVPWQDRRRFRAWSPPAEGPSCRDDDLRVRPVETDGAGGRLFRIVTVVRTGTGSCVLRGWPRLVDRDGPVRTLRRPPFLPLRGTTPPVLDRGDTARTVVTTTSACPAAEAGAPVVVRYDAALVLPGGDRVPLDRVLRTSCPPETTRFRGPAPSWPTEPPERFPAIRVRLLLPRSATAGERLEYLVELRNATRRPIDLRPCPGYRQQLSELDPALGPQRLRGGRTERRLACDDAPLLWPRGRRTYAMRAVVPETADGAELLVSWGLVDNLPDSGAQGRIPLARDRAGST